MTATAKSAITLTTSGLVDGQTIDSADVAVPVIEAMTQAKTGQLSVSATDTYVKHLYDALLVATGLARTVGAPAANETLTLSLDSKLTNLLALLTAAGKILNTGVDSGAATAGQVLRSDGAGAAAWADQAAGTTMDVSAIAGVDLAVRDIVYIDPADSYAKKMDSGVSDNNYVGGALRGIVTQAASAFATVYIRVAGEVTGFTSLTAWGTVYAGDTAGVYTQTRPVPASTMALIAPIGYATSTTKVMVQKQPILYMAKQTVSPGTYTTLTHHVDSYPYARRPFAHSVPATAKTESIVIGKYATGTNDVGWQTGDGAGALLTTATTFWFYGSGTYYFGVVLD